MISIKKTSRVITVIFIVVIFVSFLLNVLLIGEVKDDLDEIIILTNEVGNKQYQLDLPLRVVRNVIEQYEKNDELLPPVSNAYRENNQKAIELLAGIKNDLSAMNSSIKTSEIRTLSKYDSYYTQMEEYIDEAIESTEQLTEYVNYSLDEKVISDIDYIDILENELRPKIKGINQIHSKSRIEIFDVLMRFVDVILLVLIFAMLVLMVIIYRLQVFQEKFVHKSYSLVEAHDYDIGKLKDVNILFSEEKDIYNTVEIVFSEQKLSMDIKEIVTNSYDIDKVLGKLFDLSKELIGIERIGIAFVDQSTNKIFAERSYTTYETKRLYSGYSVLIDETSLKEILDSKNSRITNDLHILLEEKPNGSKSIELMLEEGILSNMIIPLISGGEVFALVFFSSVERNHFTNNHLRMAKKILFELTEILKRSYLVKSVFSRFTQSFAELVDNRDYETGNHIQRVTKYSLLIARGLANKNMANYPIDNSFLQDIRDYAAIHDIGKVSVPDEVLKKPGRLNYEEWQVMKQHTMTGKEVFTKLRKTLAMFDTSYFKIAEEIVVSHHEKWDGNGYPKGLIGEEIPLAARITAVADVFDALTSERIYKEAFTFDKSVEIIKNSSGTHFDPTIIEVFFENIDEVKEIYRVQFNEE